jgi:tetratricopeptide (TPR) repeat protein/tRNA A-37 threonylcarbamoyl transferase component Bud32
MTDPRPDVSGLESTHDSCASSPGAADDTITTRAGRYEILDEIAHGGMGIIYRATDTVLRREVAVKVLQPRLAPTAAAARRFVDEARIAGQLQHPGIPAIHDLGTLPDGRPFLAMKLIKGRTLDMLLKERGPDAPNFLTVFEQVCQAVGYAHAHGVIHRDLKLANVMVGAYGEVQVMDWGLAKVLKLGQRERTEIDPDAMTATMTQIELPREDSDATRAGNVLGTPAYMAPEQAIGAIDQVDARSDVFGLGAVLCAILTGKPPYVGADAESIRQQAARARLEEARARLDTCGAEPGLVALCQRCLSPEKADRPAEAGELALAVAGLRAAAEARARQAELEQTRAETEAREQHKRRRVQLALAAAIILLLVGGGSFAWYLDQQATQQLARQERNTAALADLLGRCEAALQSNNADVADAALLPAERRLPEGGGEAFRARVERCRGELTLLRALDAIDTFRWTPRENSFPDGQALAERWQAALARYGVAPGQAPAEQTAARVADALLQERLLAVLDLWLLVDPAAEVLEVLRAADPDPYREAVREAIAARDFKRQAALAGQPEALSQPSRFAAALGRNRAVPVGRRRLVLEAALRPRSRDLGLLMELGNSYTINRQQGADERLRWFQTAVAVQPLSVATHNSLGVALLDRGDSAGAISAFTEALRLDPMFALTHNNLANALSKKGDLDGAIRACQEAIRLDPTLALAHTTLGTALRHKGDLDGAVECCKEAIRLNPKYINAYNALGNALRAKGDLDGAIHAYQEALRHDPKAADAHYNLGIALHDQGDLDGAINALQAAIRFDPKYASAHNALGHTLREKKDVDGAIRALQEAIRLDPNFAFAYINLGNALRDKGDLDGALRACKVAIRLDPKSAYAHNGLGNALRDKKDADGAIRAYQEALRLDPKAAFVHTNLGSALRDKGDLAGAIHAYKEALRLDPKYAQAHHNLGFALRDQGELDAAIKAFQEARRLDPKHAPIHNGLGNALRAKGDLDGAIGAYKEALRLDPKYVQAHYHLGIALRLQGNLSGAIRAYQEALRLNPKFPYAHNGLGNVLYDQGNLDGALHAYKEALRFDPKFAQAHNGLGNILRDQGDLDGALHAYQEALRFDPKYTLARTNLRRLEGLRQVLPRLPDILAGRTEPTTPAEGCTFAELCGRSSPKRFAAAARLYEKAFAADPKLADDLTAFHRYNAACYAARSARGDGIDAPASPSERTALRAQALAWLRADLALHQKQAASANATERQTAAERLAHWLTDADLSGVRPGKEPLVLPAEERAAWEALWAEVRATRATAQEPMLPREEKRP